MKLLVEHKDGTREVITLVPPIIVHDEPYDVPEGVSQLTKFSCGDGMEHYFDAETGHYDGWGRCGVPADIERIIEGREILPPTEDEF